MSFSPFFTPDSAKYPPHIDENNQEVLVSPPFFTSETKKAAKNIKLEVGEIFKVSSLKQERPKTDQGCYSQSC